MSAQWGYTAANGPSTWHAHWPVAATGKRQSPVDIDTRSADADPSLQKAPIAAEALASSQGPQALLSNTGHGWKVDWNAHPVTELRGGPLGKSTYFLEQFHCHWGRDSTMGSEHTVDGVPYAGELHLVHWNKCAFSKFSEAATCDNGLAVLGIFLKVGKEHPELQKVTSLLSKVKHRGESAEIEEPVDPTKLLPSDLSYWTYLGSLTTPPCCESVTWIVFKEPIEVSEEQLEECRTLLCHCPGDILSEESVKEENETNQVKRGQLLENFRPTVPLGERQLRECGCSG
ncbi:carbonic anhydrase 2-like [Ischnura elegans]|uniref:carbonic anhydrase 2-like n=1 Tax=Ischnura elegans TaxID=197161 RepID=UPI001ED8A815|nr:carbonic anhydrase 2-like [Ischnura elegans]